MEHTITFKNGKILKISNEVANILYERILDECKEFQCFTGDVKDSVLIINVSDIVCIE